MISRRENTQSCTKEWPEQHAWLSGLSGVRDLRGEFREGELPASKPNRSSRGGKELRFKDLETGDEETHDKRALERKRDKMRHSEERHQGFRCANTDCRTWVPLHDFMGTKNRNHCPCCLASKHVDDKTGDRRSECGSRMDAVALTMKREKENRYAEPNALRGELMLVHECAGCGFHRINRIAADDNDYMILKVFEASLRMMEEKRMALVERGITVLEGADRAFVMAQFTKG